MSHNIISSKLKNVKESKYLQIYQLFHAKGLKDHTFQFDEFSLAGFQSN